MKTENNKPANVARKRVKIRSRFIRRIIIIVGCTDSNVTRMYRRRDTRVYAVKTEEEAFTIIRELKSELPYVKEYVIKYEAGNGTEKGNG